MKYKRGITFGAFDPVHIGHINLFRNAKAQCDTLIVCVSTADYIRNHKGRFERFPFVSRLSAVGAIKYVDVVDMQSPHFGKAEAIAKHQADVIFVGSDWTSQTFTGEGLGIPVIYLPRTEGISSTQLAA